MDKKNLVAISGIIGFSAVALGAFGAHGLRSILTDQMLETYKTGVLYHLIHSAVLLAIALSGRENLLKSFWFILAGTILFSFSLYVYSITQILTFAMITPIGGVTLLVGWLLIIIEGMKK